MNYAALLEPFDCPDCFSLSQYLLQDPLFHHGVNFEVRKPQESVHSVLRVFLCENMIRTDSGFGRASDAHVTLPHLSCARGVRKSFLFAQKLG